MTLRVPLHILPNFTFELNPCSHLLREELETAVIELIKLVIGCNSSSNGLVLEVIC